MANQSTNPDLTDIDLFLAGDDDNKNFSAFAKAAVTSLKNKGLTIAEDWDQSKEMRKEIDAIEYTD